MKSPGKERMGIVRPPNMALQALSEIDAEEETGTSLSFPFSLNVGTMGDSSAGTGAVGGGEARSKYYARGIHNFNSSTALDLRYKPLNSSQTFRRLINCGCTEYFHCNIGSIEASTTNQAFKILYQERAIIDGSGTQTA